MTDGRPVDVNDVDGLPKWLARRGYLAPVHHVELLDCEPTLTRSGKRVIGYAITALDRAGLVEIEDYKMVRVLDIRLSRAVLALATDPYAVRKPTRRLRASEP